MDIKSCRFCRKAFRGFSALCPACAEQLDAKYVTVRNYLDKYPGGNISVVAKESGVDEKSLLYLIREGRLALKADSDSISCMKCGAPISSGKYCPKCTGELMRKLETTKNEMESKAAPAKPKPSTDDRGKLHVLKEQ